MILYLTIQITLDGALGMLHNELVSFLFFPFLTDFMICCEWKMLSMEGITEQFEKGIFSIRRTNKSFSRTPIDLAVEQIINAEAANRSRSNMYAI